MNQPVPFAVGVLATVFTAMITCGRWLLLNDTAAHRLINVTLSWILGALIAYEASIGRSFADAGYRLFLACGVMAMANFYGVVRLFDGGDIRTTRRKQLLYNAIGAPGAVAVLIIGRPAESGLTWETLVVWAIFNIPMLLVAGRTARQCLREVRSADGSTRGRLWFGLLLLAALVWGYSAIASGVIVLCGGELVSPARDWTIPACLIFMAVIALTGVPLLDVLLERMGWDRAGRDMRRLHRLWRDVTAAVPEVVLRPAAGVARDSVSQRYRMVVEIRDALMHLEQRVPMGERRDVPADYARWLAHAVRVESLGREPLPATARPEFIARDLAAELDHLLALARCWPRAVRTVRS